MAFKVSLVAFDSEVPSWVLDRFKKEGVDFVVERCLSPRDLQRVAGDTDVVWVFAKEHQLTPENLSLLEKCGAIIRSGSGTDNVPVEEATRRGIVVVNTPDAVTAGVSDHVIGLILVLGRRIVAQNNLVHAGHWVPTEVFPDFTLEDRTVGLVGFGRIARMVVRKLSGFNPRFVAYDPFLKPAQMESLGVSAVSLDTLCCESDVISVHCPLTPDTHHLFGRQQFRAMKLSSLFVNTSRGGVVDETALVEALQKGWIAGAALDVLEHEPLARDNPLLSFSNVIITPHAAGFSATFWNDMWALSVEAAIDLAHGFWPRSYVNATVQPRWSLEVRTSGRQAAPPPNSNR